MAGSWLIGALRVTLGLDSAAFQEGIGKSQKQISAMQKDFASAGASITKAGAIMTVGITAPFAALIGKAIPAARESAQAIAQVNAALKSMGPAAGFSSQQLQGLAGHLQDISNFDDDDILKSVTANMLTFGNISGEAFERAQLAAVNLSARLGQDLQSSAIQVGKALNDPIKGITALQRVGVSFTAQQREQITAMAKAGDVAGAQKIILGELERQFGGAAKAQRDATPDAAMQQQWRTLQENVGAIALKVLPPLLNAIAKLAEWFNKLDPSTQTLIVGAAGIAAALGPVVTLVGGAVTVFGALLPVLVPVGAAFATLATTVTATVLPAIGAAIAALSPILIPLAAVAAAVGAVYLAWKNWDKITAFVSGVYNGAKTWLVDNLGPIWNTLKSNLAAAGQWWIDFRNGVLQTVENMVTGIGHWMGEKLTATWETVKKGIKEIHDAFSWLYDKVVGHSFIPDMVDEIGQHMGRLDSVMVKPALDAVAKCSEAFAGLYDGVHAAGAALGIDISNPGSTDKTSDQKAGAGMEAERAKVTTFFADTLKGGVRAAFDGNLGDYLKRFWQERVFSILDKLIDKFAAMLSNAAAGNGGGGGILGGILSGIGVLFGGGSGGGGAAGKTTNIPKLAGGGSFRVGGLGGIDRNVLSVNGINRAMVSANERIHVTPANDRRPAGPTVVQLIMDEGGLFVPRVQQVSGPVAVQVTTKGAQEQYRRQRQSLA